MIINYEELFLYDIGDEVWTLSYNNKSKRVVGPCKITDRITIINSSKAICRYELRPPIEFLYAMIDRIVNEVYSDEDGAKEALKQWNDEHPQ